MMLPKVTSTIYRKLKVYNSYRNISKSDNSFKKFYKRFYESKVARELYVTKKIPCEIYIARDIIPLFLVKTVA